MSRFSYLNEGQFALVALDPNTGIVLDQKSFGYSQLSRNSATTVDTLSEAETVAQEILKSGDILVLVFNKGGEQVLSFMNDAQGDKRGDVDTMPG
ncbi:hypothetical protein [Novipirellula caenicola]|uniref:Uncharacterized protein n=1 Tax=Novipirellula caenicola TaxID=1536901 RepID=A0ABP9W2D2_9BACT